MIKQFGKKQGSIETITEKHNKCVKCSAFSSFF